MSVSTKLCEYIDNHTVQGECQCGECLDFSIGVKPEGHTIDITFFKVGLNGDPNAEEFKKLCEENDVMATEKEVGYMELGVKVYDQGRAMRMMALGHLLGIWKVLSPEQVMPFMPKEMKMQMATRGMITYRK